MNAIIQNDSNAILVCRVNSPKGSNAIKLKVYIEIWQDFKKVLVEMPSKVAEHLANANERFKGSKGNVYLYDDNYPFSMEWLKSDISYLMVIAIEIKNSAIKLLNMRDDCYAALSIGQKQHSLITKQRKVIKVE